jgi:DnaJ family protein C protein 11
MVQSGIQGFYDPIPSMAKSLQIHYTFHGQNHYAEIPDYLPVVLPLKGTFLFINNSMALTI